MKTRMFYTTGNRDIIETTWDKPEPTDEQIEVKSIYTGVCRSDIDMYVGKFHLPEITMQGHEGFGKVTKVGNNLKNHVDVGQYVATRGEPAFSDYYNVNDGAFAVPYYCHSLDEDPGPQFIIEPVACGVNLVAESLGLKRYSNRKTSLEAMLDRTTNARPTKEDEELNILILGTGFLATVVHATLLENHGKSSITVVGRANKNYWIEQSVRYMVDISELDEDDRFDVIYDITEKTKYVAPSVHHLADAGTLVIAAEKKPAVPYPTAELLWKSAKVIYPSPRSKNFAIVMNEAMAMVEYEQYDPTDLWTQVYDRETDVKQAFEDGLNRKPGYSRGYIKW